MFWRKFVLTILSIIVLATLVAGLEHLYFTKFKPHPSVKWGVNFSQYYAQQKLGLGWKLAYLEILDQLKAKRVRLMAYWDLVQPDNFDNYNFSDLDWQIEEAGQRNVSVILVIGYRVPRYPECFSPEWLKEYPVDSQRQARINMLKAEVEHFKKYGNIVAWQVENEYLLKIFGKCPPGNRDTLKSEMALVKSLDNRPVLLTTSGELSSWLQEGTLADILGISIYRTVWSGYWFYHGYRAYPLPPDFYRWKQYYIEKFVDKVIVTEMQAEPWAPGANELKDISWQEQDKSMSLDKFNESLSFASKTGIDEIYLWGAEWWWWRKAQGDDRFWERAKEIIQAGN